MAPYKLQLFYGNEKVVDTTEVLPQDGTSHPVVGQTIDRKWQIVEILENESPEVYRVRVEPFGFSVSNSRSTSA